MIQSGGDILAIEAAIRKRCDAMLRQKLVEMLAELGPELSGVFKHATWATPYRTTLRDLIAINPVVVNADRIATEADLYSRRWADDLAAELTRATALLDGAVFTDEGRLSFVITGACGGRPARVELRMSLDLDRSGRITHAFHHMVFVNERRASLEALDKLAA